MTCRRVPWVKHDTLIVSSLSPATKTPTICTATTFTIKDDSERRKPFARDRWLAFGPQVGRWRAGAVEHVRAG